MAATDSLDQPHGCDRCYRRDRWEASLRKDPLRNARLKLELSICALGRALEGDGISWDREDGFASLHQMTEAWDTLRGLEQ